MCTLLNVQRESEREKLKEDEVREAGHVRGTKTEPVPLPPPRPCPATGKFEICSVQATMQNSLGIYVCESTRLGNSCGPLCGSQFPGFVIKIPWKGTVRLGAMVVDTSHLSSDTPVTNVILLRLVTAPRRRHYCSFSHEESEGQRAALTC